MMTLQSTMQPVPFFPSTQTEVQSFTSFVKCTCIGPDGKVKSMANWTGQGDDSSIPADVKESLFFCNFIETIHGSMDELASMFVKTITVTLSENVDEWDTSKLSNDKKDDTPLRQSNVKSVGANCHVKKCLPNSLVEILRRCVKLHLQTDKASISSFKASQVNHVVVVVIIPRLFLLLFLTLVVAHNVNIYF